MTKFIRNFGLAALASVAVVAMGAGSAQAQYPSYYHWGCGPSYGVAYRPVVVVPTYGVGLTVGRYPTYGVGYGYGYHSVGYSSYRPVTPTWGAFPPGASWGGGGFPPGASWGGGRGVSLYIGR